MTEVACIGECMIELRERPDGLITRGFGGDTLNTAIYLARKCVSVDYVSALGDDPFSEAMIEAWRREGVGVDCVLRVEGALPGLYLIQNNGQGERRFSYWRQSAPVRRLFDVPGFEQIAAQLGAYRMVYLSGITLSLFDARGREALMEILDRARMAGARVAFDTNFRASSWPDRTIALASYEDMLRRSDLVFASLEDIGLLTETSPASLEERQAAACAWLAPVMSRELVLRHDDLDCQVFFGGSEARAPGQPATRVLDTTAAGDSFAAGYIAARLRDASPQQAAAAGHRLACVVVSHPGAIIPVEAMTDDRATLAR